MAPPTFQPVTPEDASTVILIRDAQDDIEVYMTRRQDYLLFLGGFYVFPGGKMDAADYGAESMARCRGLTPEQAAGVIEGVERPELAVGLMVAAIRELFEEAGVLLAEYDDGKALTRPSPELAQRLSARREQLQSDKVSMAELLKSEGLYCSLARIHWFAHWITPATSPRRFSTYFFVAGKPAGQEASAFEREVARALWIRPEQALARWRQDKWKMIPPTIASLDTLSRYHSWEALKHDFSRPPRDHQRTVWKTL
ncbi:MAG TPA: NUDIX hydrolase [bacterium]|nr:NUDIX hydrolase [bacterium]